MISRLFGIDSCLQCVFQRLVPNANIASGPLFGSLHALAGFPDHHLKMLIVHTCPSEVGPVMDSTVSHGLGTLAKACVSSDSDA